MGRYRSYAIRLFVVAVVLAAAVYRVKLSPIPVSAFTVARGPVEAEVMGTGTLTAHTQATIGPEIQGRLVELTVD